MTRRRRSLYSWTSVRLPERPLDACVLELAAPLLERLGAAPSMEEARAAIELAVTFWNASVAASKLWDDSRPAALRALRARMCGREAPAGEAEIFDLLTERWRKHFELDPRLVRSWTYDADAADAAGIARLVCEVGLPEGVRAEEPPPIEKRIAIGGQFLDEVRIRQGETSYLVFPVERHRAVMGADGRATVYAMMPTALQLLAEGRLSPVGGASVEVIIGGNRLGPMTLVEVRCGGEHLQHDIAVLVFAPAARRGES